MEQSADKCFRFGDDVQNSETEKGGESISIAVTAFGRDKNGTYVINNSGSLSNKAHEITHGGQIVDGLVDVTPRTSKISSFAPGVDVSVLEHQAYRANYGISGNLGFGSAVQKVCGLDDMNFNVIVDEGNSLNKADQ